MNNSKENTYVVTYIAGEHSLRKYGAETFHKSDEQEARQYAKEVILKENDVDTGILYVVGEEAALISLGHI